MKQQSLKQVTKLMVSAITPETDLALIASKVGLRSVNTIKNALNNQTQIVSDEVFTRTAYLLGIKIYVVWHNGERKYFLTKNEKENEKQQVG